MQPIQHLLSATCWERNPRIETSQPRKLFKRWYLPSFFSSSLSTSLLPLLLPSLAFFLYVLPSFFFASHIPPGLSRFTNPFSCVSHLAELEMCTSFSSCLKTWKSFWPLSFLSCLEICMIEIPASFGVSKCSFNSPRPLSNLHCLQRISAFFWPHLHRFRLSSTTVPRLSSGVLVPLGARRRLYHCSFVELRLVTVFATFLAARPSFLDTPTNGFCLPQSGQFSLLY